MPAIDYDSWRHTTGYGRSLVKHQDSGAFSLRTENVPALPTVLPVRRSLEGSKLIFSNIKSQDDLYLKKVALSRSSYILLIC